MHTTYPAFAAAFAVLSLASPVDKPVKPVIGFTYSVDLQLSNRSQALNPALSLAWPYQKYNVAMPKQVKIAATQQTAKQQGAVIKAGSSTGSVTATPEPYDVEYLVPVNVAGKTMNLVLDSGSSDLWVYSDLMPTAQQSGHTVYKTVPAKIKSGQTFKITYGDGSSSSGKVYADTVGIGGVTFAKQAIEAASTVSQSFLNHVDADGLIGLSMSSLNTVQPTQQTTFFDNVKASLASPVYAVTLKQQAVGTLDFGYVDKKKYTGSLNYVNVVPANAHFWQFNLRRYAIAGVDQPVMDPFVTIVDTGTSLTYLPSTIVKRYYAKLPGSGFDNSWGGYTFPCNNKIPWMGLYMNGVKYSISPQLINWERINATHCLGGIQSSDALPFAILGDVFLKSVYVVFDYQKPNQPRVAFAPQNTNT